MIIYKHLLNIFSYYLATAVAEQHVLRLDVVVRVAVRVDVLEHVDDVHGEGEGHLAAERVLAALEGTLHYSLLVTCQIYH